MSPDNKNPMISIIIASLNGAGTLQRCIDSITHQTYSDIELFIMDGGSTDESVKILQKNASKITYWESKPDKGIYHAWNKALKIARGDYICFVGVDDYFYDKNIISKLALLSAAAGYPDLISGKVALVDINGNLLRINGAPWNYSRMKKWMIVAHPGMLHHKRLFEQHGLFADNFKIAGDYEFLLRNGKKTRHVFIDEVLVCMNSQGLSNTSISKVFYETFIIQSKHEDIRVLKATLNFVIAYAKHITRQLLRKA